MKIPAYHKVGGAMNIYGDAGNSKVVLQKLSMWCCTILKWDVENPAQNKSFQTGTDNWLVSVERDGSSAKS